MGVPTNYNKQLCDEIQAFIDSPLCRTNTDARRRFKMNGERLKKLQAKGLLKLKPTVSKTVVARMGNAAYKLKQKFPLIKKFVYKLERGKAHG
jgi:hypothetical protein